MMAFEPAAEPVLDEPGRTVRTFELEAAFAAERDRRIAAAVQEQESLLSAPKRLGDRIDQDRREPFAALGWRGAHVDGSDGRQSVSLVAGAEPNMPVAPLLDIDETFDGRRRRAEHHGTLPERPAHHRHVARLVGDALLLLVARVMLLIDDDEAEIGEGQKEGRARADHELRLVLGDRPPDAAALRRRERRNATRRAWRRSAPRNAR